jgi:hypothetical protein
MSHDVPSGYCFLAAFFRGARSGNFIPRLESSHSFTSTPCFSSLALLASKYRLCASLLKGIYPPSSVDRMLARSRLLLGGRFWTHRDRCHCRGYTTSWAPLNSNKQALNRGSHPREQSTENKFFALLTLPLENRCCIFAVQSRGVHSP